jgi:hypothetical protein
MLPEDQGNPAAHTLLQAYFQDGVLELLMGWAILAFGLYMVTGQLILSVLSWAIPLIAYKPLKEQLILPRLTDEEFTSETTQALRCFVWLVYLSAVVTLGAFVGFSLMAYAGWLPAGWTDWLQQHLGLLLAGAAALIITIIGVLLRQKEIYLIAGVLFSLSLMGAILGIDPGWSWMIAGGLILMIALVKLRQFFAQHPLHGGGQEIDPE